MTQRQGFAGKRGSETMQFYRGLRFPSPNGTLQVKVGTTDLLDWRSDMWESLRQNAAVESCTQLA